jgi:hypothetical protein
MGFYSDATNTNWQIKRAMKTTIKKTVFISSTYIDLLSHRKAIWDLLAEYDVNVKGMEAFGARKEAPIETCLNEVSQSDIYIGIIANRLGSIENNSGKSFTQLEYERAIKEDKEILIYLVNEKEALTKVEFIDFGEKKEILENFKTALKEKHTIDSYRNEEELVNKIRKRLDEIILKKKNLDISDESYEESASILKRFALFPSSYSSRDVFLRVQVNGKAFPASKEICRVFGFNYGETIGIPIKILLPKEVEFGVKVFFVAEKDSEFYFSSTLEEEMDVVCELLFSTEKVESTKANFFDETIRESIPNLNFDASLPENDGSIISLSTNYAFINPYGSQKYNPKYINVEKRIKGEGKAIFALKEIIQNIEKPEYPKS